MTAGEQPTGCTKDEAHVGEPVEAIFRRSLTPREDDFQWQSLSAGSDVSAGKYECTGCGYDLQVGSTQHLPPCPNCGNGDWDTITGGDSAADP